MLPDCALLRWPLQRPRPATELRGACGPLRVADASNRPNDRGGREVDRRLPVQSLAPHGVRAKKRAKIGTSNHPKKKRVVTRPTRRAVEGKVEALKAQFGVEVEREREAEGKRGDKPVVEVGRGSRVEDEGAQLRRANGGEARQPFDPADRTEVALALPSL